MICARLDGGDFCLHFCNQAGEQRFTFLLGFGVDIAAGVFFAVRPHGGITSLPQVVVDFRHAAGTGFPFFALAGLEMAHVRFFRRICGIITPVLSGIVHRRLRLADSTVNACRRLGSHIVGNVGVNVQRCFGGYMP